MKLLTYPNPILNQKSKDVTVFDQELKDTVAGLRELMTEKKGAGLTAIQAGIPLNIVVIEFGGKSIDAINPKIGDKVGGQSIPEGCLSLPGVSEYVNRYREVTVSYLTPEGKPVADTYTGMLAAIWQHEIGHTNGELFIEQLSSTKRKQLLGRYKKLMNKK